MEDRGRYNSRARHNFTPEQVSTGAPRLSESSDAVRMGGGASGADHFSAPPAPFATPTRPAPAFTARNAPHTHGNASPPGNCLPGIKPRENVRPRPSLFLLSILSLSSRTRPPSPGRPCLVSHTPGVSIASTSGLPPLGHHLCSIPC